MRNHSVVRLLACAVVVTGCSSALAAQPPVGTAPTAVPPQIVASAREQVEISPDRAMLSLAVNGTPLTIAAGEWFIALSMMVLGMLKLQNVDGFSTMFLNYDLLAKRWVPYGKVYPFAEFGAGALMVAGVLTWLSAPVALLIGGIGAVSVFKAVYLDKRELKCACVGGDSNVPLGFLSLTENLMMIAMAVWMLVMEYGPGGAAMGM